MLVVFAIDALEYEKVHEFGCKKLMQKYHGKTDISEFSQPRTIVLWSSFMTGKNNEEEILSDNNDMWDTKWDISETLFSQFERPVVIDLPGYSYDLESHERSRVLLKSYFNVPENDRSGIELSYNDDAVLHHRMVKDNFICALEENHDFILGYFSIIDVIGHLSFGNNSMMKSLYKEMEDIYDIIVEKQPSADILLLSDHGMEAVGRFGDHTEYGFWSTNFIELDNPKITNILEDILDDKKSLSS